MDMYMWQDMLRNAITG